MKPLLEQVDVLAQSIRLFLQVAMEKAFIFIPKREDGGWFNPYEWGLFIDEIIKCLHILFRTGPGLHQQTFG